VKVKDLYPVISPYLDIQIGDSKMDTPLTSLSYLADSGCEVDSYADYEVYALIPRIDKDGSAYLAIMVENKA
jgi:hypothetical protein